VANRAHSNITSLISEQKNRLPEEDTISVAYGIIGDYPNPFWSVQANELNALVAEVAKLKTESDYSALMSRYGVRRTDPRFWAHSDRVLTTYYRQTSVHSAYLDYNRLENR
jgi:hypothetical protein